MLNHKTIKTILTITAVCLISLARAGEKEGSKIELIPVYEKTFDDTIVDVIFDTATVSIEEAKKIGWKEEAFTKEKVFAAEEVEKLKRKVKISYPKVIITGEKGYPSKQKIKFLDKNGNIKKVILNDKTSRIIVSTNGKYILKALLYNCDTDSGGGAVLYDNDGNFICEKSKGAFYAVTDNGYIGTGFVSPEGSWYPFIIYGPSKNKVKEITLPEWGIFDAGIQANGKYFIITYRGKAGFDSTGVLVLKEKGEVVFQKILPGSIIPKDVLPLSDTEFIVISMAGEGVETEHRIIYIALRNNNWVIEQKHTPDFLGFPLFTQISSKPYIYSVDRGYIIELNTQPFKIVLIEKLPSDLKFFKEKFYQIKENRIECFNLQEVLK
uniref:Uncharacterized protein n=1 Tax=candidate division WOR-3 bacterium TaxID=2052148 RepID=A0A7V3RFZ0_UNCW3